MQAANLMAQMEIFPTEVEARASIRQRYTEALQDFVITPYIAPYNIAFPVCVGPDRTTNHPPAPPYLRRGHSVYAQYTIQVDNRDEVIDRLKAQGIPTAVHYPIPLNQQPAFTLINQGIKVSFPVAEKVAERVMSLPMHPYLTEAEHQKICQVLIANLGMVQKRIKLG
jgi:UDP-2-acetamido-2-deoxy-ribo-hexuluronate aminotransferase